MNAILLYILATILYGSLTIWFMLHTSASYAHNPRKSFFSFERLIMLSALLLHGIALYLTMFSATQMNFSFALAFSLMLWLAMCFYWVETFYVPLAGLHTIVLISGMVGGMFPVIFPQHHLLVYSPTRLFQIHFTIAMLAYSLFTLVALHAMLMYFTQYQLRHSHNARFLNTLPPILTMEKLLFRLIYVAFILLSLTMLTGIIFSDELFGQAFQLTHKTVFSILSWLMFAIIILGNKLWGWRGRKALRLILASFMVLLLAYIGVQFIVEFIIKK